MSTPVYIKFTSHRARQSGLQALSRTPQAYQSLHRSSPYGFYLVSRAEIQIMRDSSPLARFTIARGPYDDLMVCW